MKARGEREKSDQRRVRKDKKLKEEEESFRRDHVGVLQVL